VRLTDRPSLPRRSWDMTVFRVDIEVGNLQETRWEPLQAVGDSGSSYTLLPRDLLDRLGVTPHDRRPFELADDSVIHLDVGSAWVRYEGRAEITVVVFGAQGQTPLLGAHAMEGLGLGVDPVNHRLIPVRGLLK